MYVVFLFEMSGWARCVDKESKDYIRLSFTKGYVNVFKGTEEECEDIVRTINRMRNRDHLLLTTFI
jgi:hypothetical protein